MNLSLELIAVAAATIAIVLLPSRLLARRADASPLAQVAAMAIRFVLAVALALALLLSRVDHALLLVCTLGGTYLVATLVEAAAKFRKREAPKWLAR